MKCPACYNDLTEIDIGGTLVDACKGGCGGVWFDWFELKKVDEPHEAEGEILLEIERDESVVIDHERRRKCPRCEGDVIMMRHFNSARREVEVDECPKCAGFWLDADELDAIRSAFSSEDEKQKATEHFVKEYIEKNYGEELSKIQEESKEKEAFAKKFAKSMRFLCPSYYIKGKQDGGAF